MLPTNQLTPRDAYGSKTRKKRIYLFSDIRIPNTEEAKPWGLEACFESESVFQKNKTFKLSVTILKPDRFQ